MGHLTTLHVTTSVSGRPEVEVRDDAGRVLARRATWRLAERWAAWYATQRREAPREDDRPLGLEEIGAMMERMSRGR